MAGKIVKSVQLKRFAELVVGGTPAYLAAKEIGHTGTDKSLMTQGSVLLRNPEVIAHMEHLRAVTTTKAVADLTERKELLTKILRGEQEIDDFVSAEGFPTNFKRLPSGPERLKALELLGKMEGDFIEKKQISVVNYVAEVPPRLLTSAAWAKEVQAQIVDEKK